MREEFSEEKIYNDIDNDFPLQVPFWTIRLHVRHAFVSTDLPTRALHLREARLDVLVNIAINQERQEKEIRRLRLASLRSWTNKTWEHQAGNPEDNLRRLVEEEKVYKAAKAALTELIDFTTKFDFWLRQRWDLDCDCEEEEPTLSEHTIEWLNELRSGPVAFAV